MIQQSPGALQPTPVPLQGPSNRWVCQGLGGNLLFLRLSSPEDLFRG